ncbi:MAG: hypothetical protein KDC87_02755, partial [Planctomycetes bacterium]|nr:hypothetical protein [Planctomycetota bacterium]
MRHAPLTLLLAILPACRALPTEAVPLAGMEEPLTLVAEPDDETARRSLAPGSFSGLYVKAAWVEPPEEPSQPPDALQVTRVVENSPGAAAGIREGDLLLGCRVGDSTTDIELRWPSAWHALETEQAPGTVLHLRL